MRTKKSPSKTIFSQRNLFLWPKFKADNINSTIFYLKLHKVLLKEFIYLRNGQIIQIIFNSVLKETRKI